MSRQARILLLIALLGVGSVVVLGIMAERYGAIVTRQELKQTGEISAAEAERQVAAFLAVRRRLRRIFEEQQSAGARQLRESLRQSFDRALGDVNIERADFMRIERLYRAYSSGEERGPEVYAKGFEQGIGDPREIDLGPYDLLDF